MTGEQKPGGLEVVAWRFRFIGPKGQTWSVQKNKPAWYRDDQDTILERLTPAEPAEARIRELEAQLIQSASIEGDAHRLRLAAEAQLARAVEGLVRIVHWRVEMTGTPVDTEAANAWAITFDTAATEASQTLAALQQEGE